MPARLDAIAAAPEKAAAGVGTSAVDMPAAPLDAGPLFRQAGAEGTLLVYDVRRDKLLAYNPARARAAYPPASTFKIFNSLIGLETGAVKDVDSDKLPWDGHVYTIGGKAILPEVCNGDVPLRTAFPNSCVPAYQALARRVGPAPYRHYLAAAGYGNQDLSGPVDAFWLTGKLRITAYQQIDFLRQVAARTLPFSPRTYAEALDIMVTERTPAYTLRAKTGWAGAAQPEVGWWVGWVERGGDTYVFAMNLDLTRPELGRARMEITRAVLGQLGVL
ncbi:OXA-1206 family carbapenem-hydrolyzing class D beta-lactamase [Cupriavidus sp. 30B13]|uniref:OXA-1206 family carbapenem-hydrolyzing class D beta-lactamase n=1 Tax=Cupriavidus sp. 30B13 TaxID=3384241 RepID=UPI003CFBB4BF